MIKLFTKKNVRKRLLFLCILICTGLSIMAQMPAVTGVVKDGKVTIVGATITAQNQATKAKAVATTDKNGVFSFFRLPSGKYTFTITFVGYDPKVMVGDVKDGGTFSLSVVLKEGSTTLDKDVIITGTGITRNKNSFTGSTATFSGDQLKMLGTNNVIQSLRTVDPSFILFENNLAGSNPNVLPQIEVRGKTSVPSATLRDQYGQDPNQPLFILDGFETTLQTVVDLDMNRVGSVTILKDAASTALYGARASNGVVVIETIRPKPGQLRFSYSNDVSLEIADLSGYNMMNAAEKLEFERLSGRYIVTNGQPTSQLYMDQLYNDHLAAVKRGVDSYWLNDPVQNGFSNNASIFAEGGDESLIYGVGLNYKNKDGALKGSGRDSWSGNINLTYRKAKLNINNILYVRGYSSVESPYGSFSNFVNANPYYVKESENRYLEDTFTSQYIRLKVANPLYNASLPNYNTGKNLEVQNNLSVNYDFTSDLRLRAGLQMVKGNTTNESFAAPENTQFESTPILQKGKYVNSILSNFSYQANLLLTYGKVFAQKHSVTANARAEITNSENSTKSYTAVGFPEGSTGNPKFAYGYLPNAAPTASLNTYRTASATLSANYAFDSRYLFDFSYRLDGSTAFGKNNQFSPYWSTGIGWNIHQESFAKNKEWLNRLKLFANIGVTGNQNYGTITSVSVYDYNTNTNYNQFGQGVTLSSLGNPDLEPQKTVQISTGLDFSLLGNRLTGYLNAYMKRTDPLVVPVDLPSSTGVFNYPLNAGNLTYKGAEVKIGFSPIYHPENRVVWTLSLTASLYKSKYDGFENKLASLNKQQEINKSLIRYFDGYSPDDIWAAKSLGIDPATGREVFVASDGQYTFDYNTANLQAVGNTTPVAEGVLTSTLVYKGFNLGINLRYRTGGDVFNTALYNKVENITYSGISLNQDKRALYDRWKKPGDIALFKAISQTQVTPMSSRFVQRENTLTGESLNLGYTFNNKNWMRKIGMSSLNINAVTNEIFRISTVKRERGIDYPFARTVSFSLRASF
ncbi:SusC/RagA family TonB-linked outer membrane protein [Pedobacter punctiformis]|uniref:SusC/RagA family TonB-linked outer membrane protein n=1 Tax=Pedobacter punctiformis TaxID=3004097 RepID=A0ABT4L5H7_9SPHI|nr:SusC/RagA family TonB-linked outer membrane protein [Pedobacter sp. HCMS5-2]MCZ4243184.1 SusC/RagA family TonB-linked outer membrane protein [Pedobacter sp. HCMS5-2]